MKDEGRKNMREKIKDRRRRKKKTFWVSPIPSSDDVPSLHFLSGMTRCHTGQYKEAYTLWGETAQVSIRTWLGLSSTSTLYTTAEELRTREPEERRWRLSGISKVLWTSGGGTKLSHRWPDKHKHKKINGKLYDHVNVWYAAWFYTPGWKERSLALHTSLCSFIERRTG